MTGNTIICRIVYKSRWACRAARFWSSNWWLFVMPCRATRTIVISSSVTCGSLSCTFNAHIASPLNQFVSIVRTLAPGCLWLWIGYYAFRAFILIRSCTSRAISVTVISLASCTITEEEFGASCSTLGWGCHGRLKKIIGGACDSRIICCTCAAYTTSIAYQTLQWCRGRVRVSSSVTCTCTSYRCSVLCNTC